MSSEFTGKRCNCSNCVPIVIVHQVNKEKEEEKSKPGIPSGVHLFTTATIYYVRCTVDGEVAGDAGFICMTGCK